MTESKVLEMNVPIWNKLNLTIKEAAAYSNIGENRLADLVSLPDCQYVIRVGKKKLIKRRKFEEYLESISEV